MSGSDPKLPGHERRRHDRYRVNWPANCLVGSEHVEKVNVVDVSCGGMGLDRDLPAGTGQPLTIELPQIGIFRCVIAWKGVDRCGVQFLDEEGLGDGSLDQLSAYLADKPRKSAVL